MSGQTELDHAPTPKRRGRGCLLMLGGLLILLVVLAVIGAVYEPIAEAADLRAYPPPGQMVDVGGYRLHIHCTGSGSPTVVIDAGWMDWSLGWSWVQPEVAKATRVCTYDRAGMGYSEAGPLPRTAEQFARELRLLLARAGVPGPYVLVGHSMGGLTVRVYAHDYPAEVAGVVLIESMSPAQATVAPAEVQPPPTSRAFSIPVLLARIGLLRLFAGPTEDLPPEASKAFRALQVTPRSAQAMLDEGAGLPMSMVQAGVVKSLGNVPLLVLTRGRDQQADWLAMQSQLLELSSRSQQMIADSSGHTVELDQPAAAVQAILAMVAQLRQTY